VNAWIVAARPKTLSAAVVPVMAGASLVRGPLNWPLLACTLVGAVLIQIATNYINDALDFRKGADTSERLGPLRVTSAGLLSSDAVMRGAYLCLFGAALCGVPLIVHAGWSLLAIGVASIVAAYAYTGGPYPLAYRGLGEIFVIAFFGIVAVCGTYFVQTRSWSRAAVFAGIGVGCLATVLLVINNLRDVASDRVSDKRTTVVRFVVAIVLRRWFALIALPLALIVIASAWRGSGRALNKSLALAGLLQWAYGFLFLLAV
jgi:1,4-dihydroxy-2-naphthoate octaprenyltransferase